MNRPTISIQDLPVIAGMIDGGDDIGEPRAGICEADKIDEVLEMGGNESIISLI